MRIAIFLLVTFSIRTAVGADLSPYVNPCEASLKAEAQFLDDSLIAVREKWRAKVRLSFDAKKLNEPQRAATSRSGARVCVDCGKDVR
jgi:hypothetical protein